MENKATNLPPAEREGEMDYPAGWQLIETAPTDGTKVLIGWWHHEKNESPRWCVTAGWYDAKFLREWSEDSEEVEYTGAWTDGAAVSYQYEEDASYEPTHWMPLPEAPK